MIGATGVALSPIAPRGKVFVHGEYWDAVSHTAIERDAAVTVTAIDGLTLTVEPAPGPKGDTR